MPLTRAQLLMGDIADGPILLNQSQGVRPGGAGIAIGTDGIIEVDSQTLVGVMKLGQTPAAAAAAYNSYDWPTGAPTPGQQLTAVTVAGVTTLGWSDSDGIPWTAKGQLIVGTGAATDTLLNVGTDTSFLLADSGATSGLIYSNSSTSAAQMPAGDTGARPSPAAAGQIRFNTDTGKFEFYTGGGWEEVASGDPTVSTFVSQTIPSAPALATGNALIPAGTTAQRQATPAPVDGSMRFNTTTGELEVFGPLGWKTVPSSSTGAFAAQTIPTAPGSATPNVVIPGGSTADRQTAPAVVAGEMRFNTTTGKLEVYGGGGVWETLPSSTSGTFVGQTIPPAGKTASAVIPPGPTGQEETVGVTGGWMRYNTTANQLEFYNGTSWELVAPSGGGVSSFVQAGTPTALNTGDIWYDTTKQRESVWDGGAWVQPGVTQTDPTGAALIPVGLTGQQPAAATYTGAFRYNTSISQLEYSDGTTWQPLAKRPATLAEAATGTDYTVYSSPATAVAKTTADQTGFVILPSSTAAPTTTAYLHYNTTSNHLEYFNATASKTVVEREGDNMTGKLSVTPNAITAGAWSLTSGNYWTLGAIAVPLPTNLSNGQGGLIQMSVAPTSWPAAGGILKYAGGTAPAPTAFPAILPYYSDGTNVYLGKPTDNIT